MRLAVPASLRQIALAAAGLTAALPAAAAVALQQPPRIVDGTEPLVLNLLVTADAGSRSYAIPDTLGITASADLQAPVQLTMQRQTPGPSVVRLKQGEYRRIAYSVALPPALRGLVRIDAANLDAAPVLITLNRGPVNAAVARELAQPLPPLVTAKPAPPPADDAAAGATPVTPVATAPTVAPDALDLAEQGRLSFHDPMYLMFGGRNGFNAKFQLSFKFRVFQPDAPASRRFIDNLYFGYTQFSLWDLGQESAPFRDTNYKPSVFYYLADTGVRGGALLRLSLATGFEHESNGRDGEQSRAINTLFVKPTFYFGNLNDWHLAVTPKAYVYLSRTGNSDIAKYRGFADLRLAYGKPDSWEFATTLRKGTRRWYGSADTQITYPLSRLVPGTAGYLMFGYFTGFGESLLDYNHKLASQFRIGFSLSR
jgi:outer membrane phospholipase A